MQPQQPTPQQVEQQRLPVVRVSTSQMTLIGTTVAIVITLLTFIFRYVEARVQPQEKRQESAEVVQLLTKFESRLNDDHELLIQRTPIIANTAADAAANKLMLNSLTPVLAEQTRVLQKLSVWLDIQIAKEARKVN